MAITSVKIHPAIGVARVGNSPDEFFLGPERLWEPPDPPGGFKDASCRVKRQACRFRVFAYHDDNSVTELTDADAEIEWTVHLVNKKAVPRNTNTPAASLTIDPGARTLNGPDQRDVLDNGTITLPGASAVTVPLGEIRTDDDGRLLVLGGFGKSASPTGAPIVQFYDNAGWYDDVADGPVTAHVTLRADGTELDAVGAWAIVAPPKFAPQIDNVITLYDRIFQLAVDQGWLAGPANPSYTADVYPILQRARTTEAVVDVFGAHGWPDPVYDQPTRQAIFNKLKNPAGGGTGTMPQLQMATLTPTQYAVMEAWKDGNFAQDWVAPPVPSAAVTPQELDRAALSACVGAAFYPGIEAGGITQQPVLVPGNYVGAADPLRLSTAALSPGDLTQYMALPWQADFKLCATNWWPVPRPNDVIPEGGSSYLKWDRDVGTMDEMVLEWSTLGFVVRQNDEYVEVDRCDATYIALLTPQLTFQDVPQGPVGTSRKVPLAVTFEVRSTGAPVTLEVLAGEQPANARLHLDAMSVTVGPTAGNAIATARLWVVYETGPVGEVLVDQLTVRHVASGRSWPVQIIATTVARKTAAAALVLDRSYSMTEDRGDGQSKYDSLKDAAKIFVDVMLEDDAVGITRYNQDAQTIHPVTALGPADDPLDPGRKAAKDVIDGTGLTPDGATSIGDGIFEGRAALDATGTFDVKSLVVLTDGNENRSRWISDVAAQIDARTYAVGLGKPENTSAAALQTISGNNGGYLLVTGAITGDNKFLLQKYFLQILAGISNADIVLDPTGVLVAGTEQRIPFQLTEADAAVDVILLSDLPGAIDFRVQTPNGFVLEPWRALAEPTMTWRLADGVSFYRFSLPTELLRARYDHGGTWHALLAIGKPRVDRPDDGPPLLRGDLLARLPENVVERLARRIPPPTGTDPRPADTAPATAMTHMTTHMATHVTTHAARTGGRRAVPYSLLVHTYSNLSLRATLHQSGYSPGATAYLDATLAESGLPTGAEASVWAEVTLPDGATTTVALGEVETGRYAAEYRLRQAGVTRFRVRASGRSRRGYPFQREQTVTGVAWYGGDRDAANPPGSGGSDDGGGSGLLCCLLHAGLDSPKVEERLRESGVDVDLLRRCLKKHCREGERDDVR